MLSGKTLVLPLLLMVSAGAFLRSPLAVAAPAGEDGAGVKYAGLPYKGQPLQIPGTIQAEEYDISPGAVNGVSFDYKNPATKNPLRTTPDSIGLARFGNGHVTIKGEPEAAEQIYLGWTHEGEWLKYTVHVNEAGDYRIGTHISAAESDAAISFSVFLSEDAVFTTGAITIPTTAGHQPGVEVYHVWENLEDIGKIYLPAGDNTLVVKIEKGAGLNLDSFTFTKIEKPEK